MHPSQNNFSCTCFVSAFFVCACLLARFRFVLHTDKLARSREIKKIALTSTISRANNFWLFVVRVCYVPCCRMGCHRAHPPLVSAEECLHSGYAVHSKVLDLERIFNLFAAAATRLLILCSLLREQPSMFFALLMAAKNVIHIMAMSLHFSVNTN